MTFIEFEKNDDFLRKTKTRSFWLSRRNFFSWNSFSDLIDRPTPTPTPKPTRLRLRLRLRDRKKKRSLKKKRILSKCLNFNEFVKPWIAMMMVFLNFSWHSLISQCLKSNLTNSELISLLEQTLCMPQCFYSYSQVLPFAQPIIILWPSLCWIGES